MSESFELAKKNIRKKDYPEFEGEFEEILRRICELEEAYRAEAEEYDEDDAVEYITDTLTQELSLSEDEDVAAAALADEYMEFLEE